MTISYFVLLSRKSFASLQPTYNNPYIIEDTTTDIISCHLNVVVTIISWSWSGGWSWCVEAGVEGVETDTGDH